MRAKNQILISLITEAISMCSHALTWTGPVPWIGAGPLFSLAKTETKE